ncbi:hypothetical protein [Sphingomonas azotifigens]|uniref:hypothetical protein n=1 Tax=Sphingomonas azotifigens TaxID=330920 RepID=UPI000A06DB13|nr:hypothetical protein [Sphingomonas azotifigens]
MILLMLMALLSPQAEDQAMAGRTFERFAVLADHQCPARHLRSIKPADLDGQVESFEDSLSTRERRKIAAADHSGPRCDRLGHGATCPAIGRLDAMIRTRTLGSFVAFACTHA